MSQTQPDFIPEECPKCHGLMDPIPKQKEAWKCTICGTEVWSGDLPTYMELHQKYRDHLESRDIENIMSGPVNPKKRKSNSSGRRRRKNKVYYVRKPLNFD